MQNGINDGVRLGPAYYEILAGGVAQLLLFCAGRFYAKKLYDAKFIQDLMEDSDDGDYNSDVEDSQIAGKSDVFSINEKQKRVTVKTETLDTSFNSEEY